jgi:BlaI family penicillinase repressor
MQITPPQKLARREREILEIIFELAGQASAEEIRERMSEPPSYSAVRALLAKMETKGVVTHRAEGLRYIYTPTVPRTAARKSAMKRLVSVFFGGDTSQAVSALLRDEKWSEAELDSMMGEIEKIKREKAAQ